MKPERQGFLPVVPNCFNRLFIGIYLFVALELVWLRFIEVAMPLIFCHILALALGLWIPWRC